MSLSEVSWIQRREVTRELRVLFPSLLEAGPGSQNKERDAESQHGWKDSRTGIRTERGKEEGGWGRGGARLGDGHEVAWYEYLGHSRGSRKAALSSCGFPCVLPWLAFLLFSSFHLCLFLS